VFPDWMQSENETFCTIVCRNESRFQSRIGCSVRSNVSWQIGLKSGSEFVNVRDCMKRKIERAVVDRM